MGNEICTCLNNLMDADSEDLSREQNENNNDDIYSLLRKNNDRLDRIKELEDKMNFNNNYFTNLI